MKSLLSENCTSPNVDATLIGTGGARVLRHDGVQAEGVPVPLLGLGGRGHPPADLPNIGGAQVIDQLKTITLPENLITCRSKCRYLVF